MTSCATSGGFGGTMWRTSFTLAYASTPPASITTAADARQSQAMAEDGQSRRFDELLENGIRRALNSAGSTPTAFSAQTW
jgi:hypothetical protein